MTTSEKFYDVHLKAIFANHLFKIDKLLKKNDQNHKIISWRLNYSKNNSFQIKLEKRIVVNKFLKIFNQTSFSNKETKRRTIYNLVRDFVSHYRYWNEKKDQEGNLHTDLQLENFLQFTDEQKKSKTKIGDLYRFWDEIKSNRDPKYFWLKLFLFTSSLLYKSEYEYLKLDFKNQIKKILEPVDFKEIKAKIYEFENLINIPRKPRKDFENEIYWWSKWSTLHNDQLSKKPKNQPNLYKVGGELKEIHQKIKNQPNKDELKELKKTKKRRQKEFDQKRDQQFDFDLLIKILEQNENENNDFNWKIQPICDGKTEKSELNKHFLSFGNKKFRCLRSDCEKFNKYIEKEEIQKFDYYFLNKKRHFLFRYKEFIFRVSLKNFSKLISFAIQQNNYQNELKLKDIFNLNKIVLKITNFLENLIVKNQKKTEIINKFINEFNLKEEQFQLSTENKDLIKNFHEKVFKNSKDELGNEKEVFVNQETNTINWILVWKSVLKNKIKKIETKLTNIFNDTNDENKEYSCWKFSKLFKERSELKSEIIYSNNRKKIKNTQQQFALVNNELRHRSVFIANYLLRQNRYKKNYDSKQQSSEKYKNYQSCFEEILKIILNHNNESQKSDDLNDCFQTHGFNNIKQQQFNLDDLCKNSLENIIKNKSDILNDLNNLSTLSETQYKNIVQKWNNLIHSIFKIRTNFPKEYETQIIIEKEGLNNHFASLKNDNFKEFKEKVTREIERYFDDELKIDFFKWLQQKEIIFMAFCYWQVINQIQKPQPIKKLEAFKLEFVNQTNDKITEQKIALKCGENKIIFQNIKKVNFAFLMRFDLLDKNEFKKCFSKEIKTIDFENLKLGIENIFEKKWFLKKLEEIEFKNKNFWDKKEKIEKYSKFIKRKDLITSCLLSEKKENRWKNEPKLYGDDQKSKNARNSLFHHTYLIEDSDPTHIINLWFEWMKKKINSKFKKSQTF